MIKDRTWKKERRMTTIVTGANRGSGYETARALTADRSRTIVLAGREFPELDPDLPADDAFAGGQTPIWVDGKRLSPRPIPTIGTGRLTCGEPASN